MARATSGTERDASFWCLACSRLHRTRAGEAVAACPSCGAPGTALEGIVDVVDADTFLYGCHPAGPRAGAGDDATARLAAVTVRDAGRTCAVCLDELEPGASALVTPCEHVYHPLCITPWLEISGTCPLCRRGSTPEDDAPDGLVLCDLQGGQFGLGQRVAGRVFTVRILDKDGKLVRHDGVLRWFTGVCRRVRAAGGALLRRENADLPDASGT